MAEFDGTTNGDQIRESELKQPGEVRVGIILDKHRIENSEEYGLKKAELKAEIKKHFSFDGNNILFLEDAVSNPKRKEEYIKQFGAFGSMRKASLFMQAVADGLTEDEYVNFASKVDDEILKRDEEYSDHPEQNPDEAYDWLEAAVCDELLAEGYGIQLVLEDGIARPNFVEVDEGAVEKEFFEAIQNNIVELSKATRERKGTISRQISNLATKEKDKGGKTNIVVIIGADHKSLVDLFPAELQRDTRIYYAKVPKRPLNHIRIIASKLDKGKEVTERDWEKMRRNKQLSLLDKAKYQLRSRMK